MTLQLMTSGKVVIGLHGGVRRGTREYLSGQSYKAVGEGGERKANQEGNTGEWRVEGGALPRVPSWVDIRTDRGSHLVLTSGWTEAVVRESSARSESWGPHRWC